MKTTKRFCLVITTLLLTGSVVVAGQPCTAFTYQGRLFDGGSPANGLYDLQFTNYSAASGGTALAGYNTNAVRVSNGLFTVTLDFGAVFDGSMCWLEISECTNGAGSFATLAPRQALTAAPYAIYAASAGTVGAMPGLTIQQNTNGAPNVIAGSPLNYVSTGVIGATIGGGGATNYHGTVFANSVTGDFGTVGGGIANQATNVYATVGGGFRNVAGGEDTVGGGFENIASNGDSTVGGGAENMASGPNSTVAGGWHNTTSGNASTVGGGYGNTGSGDRSTVSGGHNNTASLDLATIGGGEYNTAGGSGATVGGGYQNTSSGECATIGGGDTGSASGDFSTVGGGWFNTASGSDATVGGGYANSAAGVTAMVGGGDTNSASGDNSTVGGGANNAASADYSAVGGGDENTASGPGAVVAGGGYDGSNDLGNTASGTAAAIGGGTANLASGSRSTVGGGHDNAATNWYATVPGGAWNVAGGMGSFAVGQAAKALHDGSFVWNDNSLGDLVSKAANTVTMRASGGYQLYSGDSSGVSLAAGSGSWTSMSDRNAKENFAPVDAQALLEKVSALPLSTWNYKSQDPAVRHLGPMAQDFKAAFNVGESDTGITTVDADGVALAAIQGLNQKVEAQNAALRAENAELKARLEKLERLFEPPK